MQSQHTDIHINFFAMQCIAESAHRHPHQLFRHAVHAVRSVCNGSTQHTAHSINFFAMQLWNNVCSDSTPHQLFRHAAMQQCMQRQHTLFASTFSPCSYAVLTQCMQQCMQCASHINFFAMQPTNSLPTTLAWRLLLSEARLLWCGFSRVACDCW